MCAMFTFKYTKKHLENKTKKKVVKIKEQILQQQQKG